MSLPRHMASPIGFGKPKEFSYSLQLKPPFAFEGLSARVFPLRANIDSLQRFCDSYLNIAPAEAGRFRAAVPYVFLMMLDYGKLATAATNLGWLAQREIFFLVPLQWYRVLGGQWVFHDWASVTPFIYVDDDLSVPLGRMVYGWPKTMAKVTPRLSAWMRDPLAPVNEATVSATVFPELYEGRKLEHRVFLEVERDAPPSTFQYPASSQLPFAPWIMASNMAAAMAGFSRDMAGLMTGFGMSPALAGGTPENWGAMMSMLAEAASPFRPEFLANTINLKQFRQSETPSRYCYQSITNGPMKVTAFNRGGLLGEDRIFSGDQTGGYSIKLHEWPSLPIADTLGLEVERRWAGDGSTVVRVDPVVPFWYEVNMEYLPGSNLVWRTHDGHWRNAGGGRLIGQPDKVPDDDRLFNTTLGSEVDAVAGPFRFSGTTIRVFPLIAWRTTLQTFVDEYLNDPLTGTCEKYTVWTSAEDPAGVYAYVYMTASSFADVTSTTNNIGDWANFELAFLIPVKRAFNAAESANESCVGLLPVFTYVDGSIAAVARSEVLGIPTTKATFVQPESAWMSEAGPFRHPAQMLLRVDAEVLPAIGEGVKAKVKTIVDVIQGMRTNDDDWKAAAHDSEAWSAILLAELERKKRLKFDDKHLLDSGLAMALPLLSNQEEMALFTLKQFRDVADPDKACYQAIVRVGRLLRDMIDLREIEEPIVVRIHEFPSQPIVELLGLIGKTVRHTGAGIVHELHPIRPFSLRVTLEEALGKRLMARAGSPVWRFPPQDPVSDHGVDAAKLEPPLARGIVRLQDEGDPRRMVDTVQEFRATAANARAEKGSTIVTQGDLIKRFDPQTIIEAILSREWGNWDTDAYWQRGRRRLESRYEDMLGGIDPKYLPEGEHAFFLGVITYRPKKAGQPPTRKALAMVERLFEFSGHRVGMEAGSTLLADWGMRRRYGIQATDTQSIADNPALAIKSALECLKKIEAIADLEIMGQPDSPDAADGRGGRTERDNGARLREVIDDVFGPLRAKLSKAKRAIAKAMKGNASCTPAEIQALPAYVELLDSVWQERRVLKLVLDLARQRVDLQRDAVFNKLSRATQKPDFCVRRDATGADRERLFPIAESWNEEWYYGPKPRAGKGQQTNWAKPSSDESP